MRSVTHYLFNFVAIGAMLTALSCGPDLKEVEQDEEVTNTSSTPSNQPEQDGDFVRIYPVFVDQTDSGFNLLAPATEYSLTISNCDSGFNQTFTATDGGTRLLKFDDNCTVDLTSMLVNTITYDFTNGDSVAFPNLNSGSQATMTNTLNTGESIVVTIASTISDGTSLVEPGDSIEFSFSEINQAADTDITSATTEGRFDFSVGGSDVPDFTFEIADLSMTGIQAVDGAGTFTIKIECSAAVSGGTVTDTCGANQFDNLQFKFGAHPNPGNTLTQAEVDTFFASGTTAVLLGNVRDAAADGDIANGGLVLSVTSPANLANNTDLILGVETLDAVPSSSIYPMTIDFTAP